MDPNSTPWRVLEDPTEQAPGRAGEAAPGHARVAIPRSAILTGGAAVLLAVGAFALAFGTGSSGSIAVEGGSPLDVVASGTRSSAGPVGPAPDARFLVVEIVGAVDHPGVFRLPTDARVGDLVTAAGGYGPRVDAERTGRELNLAAPLHDGDQIRVPSRDDAPGATPRPNGGSGASPAGGGSTAMPLDLNRATAAELEALPGIGPVTAAKIIGSRDEAPFVSVEDLRTRKLVGAKTFETLKDLVMVP